MLDCRKALEYTPADPLSRRIGLQQVGVLLLQPLQLAKQAVVLRIGDLRCIEHVIGMIVMADRLA